jgi:hypothetical protein
VWQQHWRCKPQLHATYCNPQLATCHCSIQRAKCDVQFLSHGKGCVCVCVCVCRAVRPSPTGSRAQSSLSPPPPRGSNRCAPTPYVVLRHPSHSVGPRERMPHHTTRAAGVRRCACADRCGRGRGALRPRGPNGQARARPRGRCGSAAHVRLPPPLGVAADGHVYH